ncbi:hypothetical protein AGDE_12341 [Angomonas deanei]|nr:hypothetical protein AGDE_12341 [Angomonas deanei]|eukprot:EPY24450.1 hypothetical protein AGDE_12341 [Angomonas deanei]
MTKSPTKSAISPVDQSEALPDRSTGSLSGGAPQNTPLGASKVSPGDSPKSHRSHPHGANGHPFTSNVHNYPSGLNHFSIHQAPANSICNSNQNFCGVDHGPQYRDPGYGRYHDAPSRQPYYPPPVNSYNPAYDPLCQYSDYSAVPSRVALVSTLAYLEAMCNDILYDAEQCRFKHERSGAQADGASPAECEHHVVIGLDLEGRDLGRNGSICVITLATEDCVYLIDIVTLGGDALSRESPLTAVLESPYVCKLMYDCRADCGALFYLYNVKLNNVCDLQAASCYNSSNSTYLPSMKDTFRRLGFFTEDELHIKERGRAFFDVRLGGSPDQWYVRPLPPLLVQYCAVDVKYFFLAREKLWNHVTASYAVGEKRINAVCAGDFSSTDNQNALRDFEL